MIEISALSVGYGKKAVLQGLHGRFEKGKLSVLLGPNGCGKSTLLKTLCGLLKPLEGQIKLQGASLSSFSSLERARRIAYLPQNRPVPPLTALELALHGRYPHLRYPRRCSPEDVSIALDALSQVGLSDCFHTPLQQLSGGQRQKAYLAMALSQQAPVILLDEPTTWLDAGCQLEVWSLCRRLCRRGYTVIAVSHDLSHALRYGDTLLALHHGRLVVQGNADTLLSSGCLEDIFSVSISRLDAETFRFDPKEESAL